MAAKITDTAISLNTIQTPVDHRNEALSILLYNDKDLSKYLQYGKQECAASDLNNPAKQHQFKVK